MKASQLLKVVRENSKTNKRVPGEMGVPKADNLGTPDNHTSGKYRKEVDGKKGLGQRKEQKPHGVTGKPVKQSQVPNKPLPVQSAVRESHNVKDAKQQVRDMGLVLKSTEDGEFRVNFPKGREETAYYTNDLDDAIQTARRMSKEVQEGRKFTKDPVEGEMKRPSVKKEKPAKSASVSSRQDRQTTQADPGQPHEEKHSYNPQKQPVKSVKEQRLSRSERKIEEALGDLTEIVGRELDIQWIPEQEDEGRLNVPDGPDDISSFDRDLPREDIHSYIDELSLSKDLDNLTDDEINDMVVEIKDRLAYDGHTDVEDEEIRGEIIDVMNGNTELEENLYSGSPEDNKIGRQLGKYGYKPIEDEEGNPNETRYSKGKDSFIVKKHPTSGEIVGWTHMIRDEVHQHGNTANELVQHAQAMNESVGGKIKKAAKDTWHGRPGSKERWKSEDDYARKQMSKGKDRKAAHDEAKQKFREEYEGDPEQPEGHMPARVDREEFAKFVKKKNLQRQPGQGTEDFSWWVDNTGTARAANGESQDDNFFFIFKPENMVGESYDGPFRNRLMGHNPAAGDQLEWTSDRGIKYSGEIKEFVGSYAVVDLNGDSLTKKLDREPVLEDRKTRTWVYR